MREIFIRPAWIVIVFLMIAIVVFMLSSPVKTTNPVILIPAPDTAMKIDLSKFKNAGENENCFKCHGQSKYEQPNKETGKSVAKRMYSELIISRNVFYVSNHRQFKCMDCHSEDYSTFPHPGNLRSEAKANCIDCHGGDAKYAQYHFEKIDTEFMASVHSQKHSQDFTCWMCHNAHTYKINARTNQNIKETVLYDNAICLDCHVDYTRFQLLTEKKNPNLMLTHAWLPNQEIHFRSVRCIECHTKKQNDSLLVAHKILPKKEAVRNCKECHSSNSKLMAALYKYQVSEVRTARGYLESIITSKSYVIGANRNYYLNVMSAILLGLTIIGILIHAFLRIKKRD